MVKILNISLKVTNMRIRKTFLESLVACFMFFLSYFGTIIVISKFNAPFPFRFIFYVLCIVMIFLMAVLALNLWDSLNILSDEIASEYEKKT